MEKVAFSIGPVSIHWYGIIIVLGMCLGLFLSFRETKRQHLSEDDLMNMILLILPAAVIGARLYYVAFRWEAFAQQPLNILKIWEGGLAIHGGVIAGIIVVLIYCHIKNQSFLRWGDILAPSLILGQAIGRWGNFVNAEAYGPVIAEGSFWSWMPLQVFANGEYHHPTFLYESVWDLLVFVCLFVLIRKRHKIGSVFASYLILYSVGRFFIEALRMDSLMIGDVRTAMVVSAIMILAGILILWRLEGQPKVDVSEAPQLAGAAEAAAVVDADTAENAAPEAEAEAKAEEAVSHAEASDEAEKPAQEAE